MIQRYDFQSRTYWQRLPWMQGRLRCRGYGGLEQPSFCLHSCVIALEPIVSCRLTQSYLSAEIVLKNVVVLGIAAYFFLISRKDTEYSVLLREIRKKYK